MHQTVRGRLGRLLNILFTFNLRPVSRGFYSNIFMNSLTHLPLEECHRVPLLLEKLDPIFFVQFCNFSDNAMSTSVIQSIITYFVALHTIVIKCGGI